MHSGVRLNIELSTSNSDFQKFYLTFDPPTPINPGTPCRPCMQQRKIKKDILINIISYYIIIV
jgi:hypothetical protein